VSRLEVDVALQLSKLPVRAQVVFVVDASYSVGDALAAELEIACACARVVPDAEIELVAYRRAAGAARCSPATSHRRSGSTPVAAATSPARRGRGVERAGAVLAVLALDRGDQARRRPRTDSAQVVGSS
jgi:hypothetical protein